MALGRYKTAGAIILDAARELGLGTTTDPYASTDEIFQGLVGFLKTVGNQLAEKYTWRHLTTEAVLTKAAGIWTLPAGWTVASGDELNLPADFVEMAPQSGWDRTNRLPLGGPLNVQLWQYRKSSVLGSIWAEFRLDTNQLRFLPTPLPDSTFALEYRSRAWVRPAASGLGNGNTLGMSGADEPAGQGDFVLFDRTLILAALKLAWKKDRGFDTTTALADYEAALATAQGIQTTMPVLSLTGSGGGIHFLDGCNVPDTGYGS